MKKISTFLAVMLMFYAAESKTSSVSVPSLYPYFGGNLPANNPSTGTPSRIIGSAYSEYDGSKWQEVDSITYSYAFGRGGELNEEYEDDFVNFENSYTYWFEKTTGTYVKRFHRSQTYNALGRATYYTCQTWKNNLSNWKDSSRFEYTYNTDNTRLMKTDFQLWYADISDWIPHVIYNNEYDAAGRMTAMKSLIYRFSLTYDLAGNIVQRLDESKASGSWQSANRFNFSYNTSNQLTSYTVELWDGSVWNNTEKYEFSYVGTDVTNIKEYHWTSGSWELFAQDNLTYDAGHNKLSDERQLWDGTSGAFVSAYLLSWTYNSHNQPLTYTSRTWDAASSLWVLTTDDFYYRYYYQEYIPTDVREPEIADIGLYPMPATDILNVSVKMDKPQACNIAMYDAQGRMVKQDMIAAGTNTLKLPVNDLAAGNYFIKIATASQEVSRPVVVMH